MVTSQCLREGFAMGPEQMQQRDAAAVGRRPSYRYSSHAGSVSADDGSVGRDM